MVLCGLFKFQPPMLVLLCPCNFILFCRPRCRPGSSTRELRVNTMPQIGLLLLCACAPGFVLSKTASVFDNLFAPSNFLPRRSPHTAPALCCLPAGFSNQAVLLTASRHYSLTTPLLSRAVCQAPVSSFSCQGDRISFLRSHPQSPVLNRRSAPP